MPRVSTDHATILDAVVKRIRSQIPEFSGTSCIVSFKPEPAANVDKNLFCTVAPTDGQFELDNQIGGGAENLVEQAGVAVTMFSAMKLDRSDVHESVLMEKSRGLLVLKKKLLKALVGHDLQTPNGDYILASQMHALRASQPGEDGQGRVFLQVTFSTDFGWDIGA